jgi:hypothetical protein
MTTVFVYGTLMHHEILKWVLNNDASHLHICPAILTVGPLLRHPTKAFCEQLTYLSKPQHTGRTTRDTKSK